jgi:hypothetical protein
MRFIPCLLTALLVTALAPATEAQVLDGQWFKVIAVGNGVGLDPETDEAEKGRVKKTVRYAYLSHNESGGVGYSVQLFNPYDVGGGWDTYTLGNITMLDLDETFVLTGSVSLYHQPVPFEEGTPNVLHIEFNGPVKTRIKKEELKSARITTLGATCSITDEGTTYYGRGKITFIRIPASKLPFDVTTLADPPPVEAGTHTADAKAALPPGQ